MSNLISRPEMEELTGAKRAEEQCRVLIQNGIRFTKRADGRPSLSWEAYHRQITGAANQAEHSGPNLKAI